MMKKVFLIILGLIGAGLIYLAVAGSEMQEIKTEIEISAPPNGVWPFVSDVEKWPEWSPIIKSAQGTVAVGSELTIGMVGKKEGEAGPVYKPVILEMSPPNLLSWRANMGSDFLFTNYKIIELKETDSGTLLIHKEAFKGMLSPIFCKQMEEGVPPMLNAMNLALKKLVEKLYQ